MNSYRYGVRLRTDGRTLAVLISPLSKPVVQIVILTIITYRRMDPASDALFEGLDPSKLK